MMSLWVKFLRNGSITTNSRLVFASKKALHECAKQRAWNLVNFVHFPKQCTFLCVTSSFPNSLPHSNCRSTSSSTTTSSEGTDNDGISQSDSNNNSDDQVIEWTGEIDEVTLTLSEEEIKELSGGDPEIIKRIRYIQLEHEICRQHGTMVPLTPIKVSKWQELLRLNTASKRKRYYEFLFKTEKKIENERIKKQLKKEERMKRLENEPQLPPLGEDPDGVIYGIHRNTMFVRLYETKVNEFYNNKLIQEMMFGETFILDCGYGEYMNLKEAKNCSKQLEYGFVENREHPRPFNLHFCNAYPEDEMIQWMYRRAPNFSNPEFPINITNKSYLDLYPREKLVYLSPHAADELLDYNHDDIYIMGCLVDKGDQRPLSAAKAKRENIRMKKLPLDRYLDWGFGSKCLTLNQVLKIMLDQRLYHDWNKSFVHIPPRKIKGGREGSSENTVDEEDDVYAATKRDRKTGIFSRNGFRRGESIDEPIRSRS